VFDSALANQEQHTDLDTKENRNKRDTCFYPPWWGNNDQRAFGVALADRGQHIDFEWPWRGKNAQRTFGVALACRNACLRKCVQKYTLTAQAPAKATRGLKQAKRIKNTSILASGRLIELERQ
jgi:hypothetical protein